MPTFVRPAQKAEFVIFSATEYRAVQRALWTNLNSSGGSLTLPQKLGNWCQLYKNSETHMPDKIESVEDKRFQGLQKLHANSTIPVKASKNHKLTKEEKKLNREISKRRIEIEHINRYIKRFHILSYRYRNKRKRFALRASLICGIYNFQHAS